MGRCRSITPPSSLSPPITPDAKARDARGSRPAPPSPRDHRSPRAHALFIATWWLLAFLLAGPTDAADGTPADLVLVRRGTLPIILTAPHGGRDTIPGIDPRRAKDTTSRQWGGVRTGTDPNTDLLAQQIASEVAKLTGREPYLIVAKYQRKYIDANRPPELALEDPRARPYYDYYHQAIRRFVDEIRAGHPAGLLIDVHGQSKDPDVIMRGTLNGRAVERLVRRAGVDAGT